jgi:vacuolar-type H+-ATPase subunit F/Vma7
LSDQEKETEDKEGQKEEAAGVETKDVDSLADLSELEKIKLELQKEKEKAATELAEGEDEEEDLREIDYLQKLITLSVQFDHHCSMWLLPAHIDCGLKFDHKLSEAYANQLNTIQSFLRLLENVDGVTREMVTKDVILKLRNTLQLIFKNLVKPLILEVGRMKKKPKSESLDNFITNWNERLGELQKACDFEYQVLDCKGFMIKE